MLKQYVYRKRSIYQRKLFTEIFNKEYKNPTSSEKYCICVMCKDCLKRFTIKCMKEVEERYLYLNSNERYMNDKVD